MDKKTSYGKVLGLSVLLSIILSFALIEGVFALAPPTDEDVEEMIANGTYQEQVEAAYRIGNNVPSARLLQKAAHVDNPSVQTFGVNADVMAPPQIPPSWQSGMPSIGEGKVLTILVDFSDYQHSSSQTVENMTSVMYGAENTSSSYYPYESLAAYYDRSSYGKFKVTGEVWGWYRAPQKSTYYRDSDSYDELIESAINYFIAQGKDITPYDNDGDGTIEAIYFKWTVPEGLWASYWWAKATSYYGGYSFQNKEVGRIVWMPYKCSKASNPTGAAVEIHEFGHVIGLPDLYDYAEKDDKGKILPPSNSLGGLDMMDTNKGDHNAFSKFLLGWLEPKIISTGSSTINLRPTSEYPEAVLIMPDATLNACSEYYIAQYRKGTKNDKVSPYTASSGDGLVIWHIDATLSYWGYDFEYNNADSPHPLITIVRRGTDQSSTGYPTSYSASGTDFYRTSAHTLTPTTKPNSNNWAGGSTGISINNMSIANSVHTATYAVSSNKAPKLLSAVYEKDIGKIVLTYDCFISAGANFPGMTIAVKNKGTASYTATIQDNKVFLTLSGGVLPESRYNIAIPQNAVKTTANMGSDVDNVVIITPPSGLFKIGGIGLLNTDYNAMTTGDSIFTTSSWEPISYLTPDMSRIAFDFYVHNNNAQKITVQPIIAYYVDGKVVYSKVSRVVSIAPYQTENVYDFLDGLPSDAVEKCVIKVFLWNGAGLMEPYTNYFVIQ